MSLTRAGLDVRGDRYGHEKYLGPCRARVLVFAVAGAQTPFRETFPPRKRSGRIFGSVVWPGSLNILQSELMLIGRA